VEKQEASPWWQQLLGLVVLVMLLYFIFVPPQSSGKESSPAPSPTPTATSSLPDNCWHTDTYGGVECYDPRPAPPMVDLSELYAEQARLDAEAEAAWDQWFNEQMDKEWEALQREEESRRMEAAIEADLRGEPPPTELTEPAQSDLGATGEAATLVRVIDGDTIVVEMGGQTYSVRYIGVDTPEAGQYGFGQATEANRQLLAKGPLHLQKDVSETDQYGRILRYVFAGDVFVNAELVRLGYAYADTWPPDVKYSDYFVQLQREARETARGLWAE
jgi:endonuclease YncB( thermonuclease family)